MAFLQVAGESSPIIHRIVSEGPAAGEAPGGFVTRGDANAREDDTRISRRNVLGRAVLILPTSFLTRMFK